MNDDHERAGDARARRRRCRSKAHVCRRRPPVAAAVRPSCGEMVRRERSRDVEAEVLMSVEDDARLQFDQQSKALTVRPRAPYARTRFTYALQYSPIYIRRPN